MKLLIIVAISMSLMACSFSKDKNKDNKNAEQAQSRADVDALLMTTFERLAVSIIENDSKAFNLALAKAKRSDLNQRTPGGKSLLELCIESDRFDFFRDLIDAGIAPYMPTKYSDEGLRKTLVPQAEFRSLVLYAQKKLAQDASAVCVKNDVQQTISFLKESYAHLYVKACGAFDLFEYHFMQPELFDESKISLIVDFAADFRNETVMGMALSAAILAKNVSAIRLIDEKILVLRISPKFSDLEDFIINSTLEELIDVYSFVEAEHASKGASSIFLAYKVTFDRFKTSDYRPSPPPAPNSGSSESFENGSVKSANSTLIEGIRQGVRYRMSTHTGFLDELAEFEALFLKYGVSSN